MSCFSSPFRFLVISVLLFLVFISIIILLLKGFSHQCKLMVFHWSLSESKSSQVFRTLPSILGDLSNAVVWTLSTSSPSTSPLVTVPSAPITIAMIVTFMFLNFSVPEPSEGTYPSFRFLPVLFFGSLGQQSTQFYEFSLFCWLSYGLVVWPRLGDLFVSQKFQTSLCI